jgi:mono/diheme cytochrome c family protein
MRELKAICALLFSAALMLGQSTVRKDAAITAVTGESWLHHLDRSFDETSMGKTWRLGPATDEPAPRLQRSMLGLSGSAASGSRMETLHGSDLYRLNCQGCHGEYGLGAPPEIGSLIDAVRATSVTLVTERMKKTGLELSRRETAELVNQSRSALLKRLHEGGKDMPSFHHLSEAEIRSLVAYLGQLAGVPGAEKEQVAIQEPHARVGELIVKSTCHVCHDAAGLNPAPAELLDGAIPPLRVLTARVNQAQLVRKVTSGAPVVMNTTSSVYRGRMPVFSYLRESEAADIYEFLTQYPPTESASRSQTAQTTRSDATDPPTDSSGAHATVFQPALPQAPAPREQTESAVLPVSMGLFTAVFLVLGCWITLREFKRISVKSQARRAPRPARDPALWVTLRPGVELGMNSSPRSTESVERKSSVMEERKIS